MGILGLTVSQRLVFISRSTSAYTFVVVIERVPAKIGSY